MRILIAGASGVLGRSLIPKLLARGHSVVGTSSSSARQEEIRQLGAEAILMSGVDRRSVFEAVAASAPDVVVNEMTSLSQVRSYRNFDTEFGFTNRLRTEGTAYLLEAAKINNVHKAVVQSFAGWPWQNDGEAANTEDATFEAHLPSKMRATQNAIREMEAMVIALSEIAGVALRYGYLYGEGTSLGPNGDVAKAVKKRAVPVVGDGGAVWSFVHVDDAAEATRLAIESAPPGIYNIVDDMPAKVAEWLPEYAKALGAKRPMNVPAWLARVLIGESGVFLMTKARGAKNARARKLLGWEPAHPDWRAGFAAMFRA